MLHFPKFLRHYFDQYVCFSAPGPEMRQAWQASYRSIIQKASWLNGGKPLILKNPPNTARVALLLELYPNAKFIYLHRDPAELYFSTQRSIYEMMGVFQLDCISKQDIEQHVLHMYPNIIRLFLQQQAAIPPENFCCLSYQQLKENPQQALAFIYDRLKLPSHTLAAPKFAAYCQTLRDYRVASYQVDQPVRTKLDAVWGPIQAQHQAWLATLGNAAMPQVEKSRE